MKKLKELAFIGNSGKHYSASFIYDDSDPIRERRIKKLIELPHLILKENWRWGSSIQSYFVDDDDDFGYYPPYMIDKYNDNFEVLLRELKEIKDIESVDVGLIYQLFDNNLYKLKVFK